MILLMKVGILNQHPLPLFHEIYFRQICITAFALEGQPILRLKSEFWTHQLDSPREVGTHFTLFQTAMKMCTSLIDEMSQRKPTSL